MKRNITIWAAVAVVFAAGASGGTYSGGAGTSGNPYKISTAADWQELIATSADWDKSFILLEDIDFGGVSLTPVGSSTQRFTGVFDGGDHIIGNARIDMPSASFVGLFGMLGTGAEIRNLGIEGVYIRGKTYAGGLAAVGVGTIRNCHLTGSITANRPGYADSSYMGSLVGSNYGTITNCRVEATVTGAITLGGLVGSNSGILTDCRSTATVQSTGYQVGGLVGFNSGIIRRCVATGTVSGTYDVGGLVGYNSGAVGDCYTTTAVTGESQLGGLVGSNTTKAIIEYCFSTGLVTASTSSSIGGMVGDNFFSAALPIGSFWDIQTSGQTASNGGEGKTTAEMKTLGTFTNAGWDFVAESANGTKDVWRMCDDGTDYPRLAWEFSKSGDIDCPDGVAMEDLLYLAGRWMASLPLGVGAADSNGDGKVDLADFAIMTENWMM